MRERHRKSFSYTVSHLRRSNSICPHVPAQKGTSLWESKEEGVAVADWLAFPRKISDKIKTPHFSVANQSSSPELPQFSTRGSIMDETHLCSSQFQ